MSQSNEQSLGDAIKAFLKNFRLEDKITETRIKSSWEKVMGHHIAKYTSRVELRNKTLVVTLKSSVLRNELSMGKTKIIDIINKEAGSDAVKEIVFR